MKETIGYNKKNSERQAEDFYATPTNEVAAFLRLNEKL